MEKPLPCALCSLLLLLLIHVSSAARDRDLIGWSEVATPKTGAKTGAPSTVVRAPGSNGRAPTLLGEPAKRGMEVLSWDPRIFLYRGFLSEDECDQMVRTAEPRLTRSGVVDTDTGNSQNSEVRTSYGMFFAREETPWIAEIERRLSEWLMIPVGNGEGLQVLRYQNGQQYRPHFDYFFHQGAEENGGNRLATVLMYLSTPIEGGETVFPNVKAAPSQTLAAGFSECAMKGLAVKPRKGDAVVFWSLRTDGTLDKGALHAGCPVIAGTKYAATKWFHVGHHASSSEKPKAVHHVVYAPSPPPAPAGCKDSHFSCPKWAEGGECENNPAFMVGDRLRPGTCLLSCGRCDLMPASRV